MSNRASQSLLALALFSAALAPDARAATFDLVVTDSINVLCGPANSGFTQGSDIGLVVNKGSGDIAASDLSGATIVVASSDPQVAAMPFILNEGLVAPLHPDEAVGNFSEFGPLPSLVLPGETLRNTSPTWFYGLGMGYPVGSDGTVVFDVTVTLGTDVARYSLWVRIQPSTDTSIFCGHATRVSGVPIATAARASTWGALKKLYR